MRGQPAHGSDDERLDFELPGDGNGIHWPLIDEDISIARLLQGRPSVERGAVSHASCECSSDVVFLVFLLGLRMMKFGHGRRLGTAN
ncbi:DUF2442 domain-containing protein [Ottowia sp.]|uniref:DUF2442 domain-containing protein n=1 Tax=Ottowia sp. TaxID=1898956 RepID=UPI00396486D5|nr:DUF2442 domain-containing protein [Pseudomonadota bacterium]